jgi:hypothetical protein
MRTWIPGGTPIPGTDKNSEWRDGRCVTTKRLTFAEESELDKLLLTHVGELCGKQSALVTKSNDGRHSLLFAYLGSIMRVKAVRSQKRKRVTRRWGMDELGDDGEAPDRDFHSQSQ